MFAYSWQIVERNLNIVYISFNIFNVICSLFRADFIIHGQNDVCTRLISRMCIIRWLWTMKRIRFFFQNKSEKMWTYSTIIRRNELKNFIDFSSKLEKTTFEIRNSKFEIREFWIVNLSSESFFLYCFVCRVLCVFFPICSLVFHFVFFSVPSLHICFRNKLWNAKSISFVHHIFTLATQLFSENDTYNRWVTETKQ